jgi:hypothetical protein
MDPEDLPALTPLMMVAGRPPAPATSAVSEDPGETQGAGEGDFRRGHGRRGCPSEQQALCR